MLTSKETESLAGKVVSVVVAKVVLEEIPTSCATVALPAKDH